MKLLTYIRIALYFLFTALTLLFSFLPLEFIVYHIVIYVINHSFEESAILLFFSPLIFALGYLLSTIVFILVHSQIICRIFLPSVKKGVYSHKDVEKGHLYGIALTRDSVAKSLISFMEWIPFLSQVLLKPYLFRFYGMKLGKNVYIATQTYIDCALTTIGDNSFVGHRALISNHLNEHDNTIIAPVTIGKNCVIGGLSLISPGVEIGDNVIIGAYSFVPKFKKIPSNTIWFGIPAKQYVSKNEEKKVKKEEIEKLHRQKM